MQSSVFIQDRASSRENLSKLSYNLNEFVVIQEFFVTGTNSVKETTQTKKFINYITRSAERENIMLLKREHTETKQNR